MREEAAARGLTNSRENLVRVGNELRQSGGPGALVDRLRPRLKPPAIVDSVRNPGEVEALRTLPGFFLLGVDAPAKLRFSRIQARGRLGDISTAEEFRTMEARENSGDIHRQRLNDTLALADAVVINDASLEDLQAKVRAALTGAE